MSLTSDNSSGLEFTVYESGSVEKSSLAGFKVSDDGTVTAATFELYGSTDLELDWSNSLSEMSVATGALYGVSVNGSGFAENQRPEEPILEVISHSTNQTTTVLTLEVATITNPEDPSTYTSDTYIFALEGAALDETILASVNPDTDIVGAESKILDSADYPENVTTAVATDVEIAGLSSL